MVSLTIALRSLMRRKFRVAMIGLLVFLGTVIIIFGETFTLSAKHFSKMSIVNNFTGDAIIYSARYREKPSPFSFTTPLPVVPAPGKISDWLAQNPLVDQYVAIAQNYGLMSVEKHGRKVDVPFIFYAVDPIHYRKTFPTITMKKGLFFNTDSAAGPAAGVVLSAFQVKNYASNYSIDLEPGDAVTLLSLNEGGSVNAYPSRIIGIYEPKYYKNIFNYINFLDITSYSRLYNFTGVEASSLPADFNKALSTESDDDILGLANGNVDRLDTKALVSQELTGYSMIAVKLKDSRTVPAFVQEVGKQNFGVKVALWNEASGFFAYIASIIQAVIYGATFLIFLIVVFILMNTLIINVIERTGEIGTLRALGAEKSFITLVFMWESLLLNGAAALLGMMASGILILAVGRSSGIVLPDVMQQYLVGGGGLRLIFSVRPFAEAVVLILAVSGLATVYPIRVATSITPLKAMSAK
jgi:putative ABC transport system permease protein